MKPEYKALVISHARPITPELLATYRESVATIENEQLKAALLDLCEMVEVFHQTPDVTDGPRDCDGFLCAKLPSLEIHRIWESVPYLYPDPTDPDAMDCDKLKRMIAENLTRGDYVDERTKQRVVTDPGANAQWNAARHLRYYAVELAQDYQPRTTDLRK